MEKSPRRFLLKIVHFEFYRRRQEDLEVPPPPPRQKRSNDSTDVDSFMHPYLPYLVESVNRYHIRD